MVASRYDKEDEADFRSGDDEPSLWSHNPIEKEAREVYTRRVYSEFKNQLRASTGYELTELKENLSYKVSIMPDSTLPYQTVQSFTVSINPSKERVECSCKYFEFSGLLCSHALKVMIHLNMRKIPPDYIMKRWTKVAKRGSLSMKLRSIEAGDSLNSKALRFNALSLKVQKIPFETSKNFESYQMACEKIDRLVEEIISLNQALMMILEMNKPCKELHVLSDPGLSVDLHVVPIARHFGVLDDQSSPCEDMDGFTIPNNRP
ncbi:Protein FAR-RED IMPAIRED RESPONSE 1 [Ananas comosus]|uniref:Protein FAR1-RELATED SEQUENCE n=1 Tax=Ananas comosus TaxID=4615 RepID=A0A199VY33_ANACO|nr:Protein FAR-RED IMPAIRED RESPONSE 1 [Ananas comosus]